jgi:hypothetical protein
MKIIKSALFAFLFSLLFTSCEPDPETILNVPPVSEAGSPKTITLPINSVSLTGIGSDADGQVKAYLWSQVSGPAVTSIVNPGSTTTLVQGFIQGTYVFQLMVTDDDGATGTDTVSVTVNPVVEKTATYQPANNPFERMIVRLGTNQDLSFSGGNEWVIDAWTLGGSDWIGRKAFKFDLSNIPANSTIVSANLYLYSNTPPENGNLVDANFGSSNGLTLQQITSNWVPANTNWSNQPQTTTTNQVLIPSTTQSVLDLNIDVTAMVGSMINTNANYGFLLKLTNEVTYNSRQFVSSYHAAKQTKHPKLVVVYR